MKWSVSMHELQSNVMNCIFIALFQVLQVLYNGSFIHTLGGEAANSRRQRPHFPHSHTNGGKADTDRLIGGNVGFSVLPKDTSTCGQEIRTADPRIIGRPDSRGLVLYRVRGPHIIMIVGVLHFTE